MASCSGDGALFCDGEFVLAGDELNACINALIELGMDELEGSLNFESTAGGFCSVSGSASEDDFGGAAGFALGLGLLGFGWYRRRRAA